MRARFIAQGAAPACATAPGPAELSLEELPSIEITSVARRPERLSVSPASVHVIKAEAIRRSGASTPPSQPLRPSSNRQMAQVSARQRPISAEIRRQALLRPSTPW